jgi:hypothetical protein
VQHTPTRHDHRHAIEDPALFLHRQDIGPDRTGVASGTGSTPIQQTSRTVRRHHDNAVERGAGDLLR